MLQSRYAEVEKREKWWGFVVDGLKGGEWVGGGLKGEGLMYLCF